MNATVEQLYFKKCERCERHRLSVVAVITDDETQFLCALCRSDDEGWKKLVTTMRREEEARGQNIVDIATARAERLLGAQVAGDANQHRRPGDLLMTNPKKSAAMRARYAKLREPILKKLRALVKETPTLTAMELVPLLRVNYSTVRLYAKEAGLELPRSPIGRRPGYKEKRPRPPVPEEVRRRRAASIAATAEKKRAAVLDRLRPLLAANPEASNHALARAVGVSANSVARVLAAAGIRERQVLVDLGPALEAYRAGQRRDDVCREFHVGPARLMAAVRAAGIPYHKPPGRPPGTGKAKAPRVPRRQRAAVPAAPVDQPRVVSRWHTASLRLVRIADEVLLASTNSPETALRLCSFFGPGVEMRRAA